MKDKKIILSGLLLVVLLVGCFLLKDKKLEKKEYKDTDLNVVLSLEDKITKNSVWCGTFNLIWNDLKSELAKQDIVFEPQLEIVENLNEGTFNTKYLNNDSYYKKLGIIKPELKVEIEKAIKDKFSETSNILNDFDFTYTDDKNYFLYAMLKKEFNFPYIFTDLDKSNFKDVKNVKYFGINSNTDSKVYNQVEVLYYDSKDSFAVKLKTKENEEVILARGFKSSSFKDIYEEIENKKDKYDGSKTFNKEDTLKIPEIKLNIKKEFEELENKPFNFADGDTYIIEKAMQTIEFELDKKGGKIKSEAGMEVKNTSSLPSDRLAREFIFDNDFVIMLKESDKELPYFAAFISDIRSFQDIK